MTELLHLSSNILLDSPRVKIISVLHKRCKIYIIKKGGIAGCILLFYALIELKAGKPIVAGRMSTLKSKSRYATKGMRPWPGGHLWSLGARK